MGTTVSVVSASSADRGAFVEAIRSTESTFRAYEERFSRFLETSELSRVNSEQAHGRRCPTSCRRCSVPPSTELAGATVCSIRRSCPRSSPPAMTGTSTRCSLKLEACCRSWTRVVDGETSNEKAPSVRLPPGVALDFGGIAKGWTVDVAATLGSEVLPWVLGGGGGRSAGRGGRRYARPGRRPPGSRTTRPESCSASGSAKERSATSSVTRRSWGPHLHHLIDPRTGQPSRTGVVQATAWAPTCREAELSRPGRCSPAGRFSIASKRRSSSTTAPS